MMPGQKIVPNVICKGELRLYTEYTGAWIPVMCHLRTDGWFHWRSPRNRHEPPVAVDLKVIMQYFVHGELLLQLPILPQTVTETPLERMFAFPRQPNWGSPICYFRCKDVDIQNTWVRNIIQMLENSHFTRPVGWRRTASSASESGSSYQSSTISSVTLPIAMNPRKSKIRSMLRHQKSDFTAGASVQSKNPPWHKETPNMWTKMIAIAPVPPCRTVSCNPTFPISPQPTETDSKTSLGVNRIVFDEKARMEAKKERMDKNPSKATKTPKWLVHQFVGIAWTRQRTGR